MRLLKHIFRHMKEDTISFLDKYLYGISVFTIAAIINVALLWGFCAILVYGMLLPVKLVGLWLMIAAVGQILLSIWIIASANQARKTIKEENAVMMSVLGSKQNKSDKYR